MTRTSLTLTVLATLLIAALPTPAADFSLAREGDALVIRSPGGREALRYQLVPPAGTGLSVESGCYFHPLVSPAGVTLTEVAPPDHKHHRGIFLAWVEMHGEADADFWGWGEHAPKQGRKVENRKLEDLRATPTSASFRAQNEWMAGSLPLVRETLDAVLSDEGGMRALDLTYTFRVDRDLTLSRWAFSGFCVRVPKAGTVESSGPDGVIRFRDPIHVKPETDWPSSPWYDFTLDFGGGSIAGVSVLDHPLNPPTQWHNNRPIRMLNPCIVAPSAVILKPGQPLVLRYRVLAHDGPLDTQAVQKSWQAWSAR